MKTPKSTKRSKQPLPEEKSAKTQPEKKQEEPPKRPLTEDEVASEVAMNLKLAALKGAEEINKMITDKDVGDSTRLAAAKWAVERAEEKDKGPDKGATIGQVMDLVRELRAQTVGQKVEAAVLPGETLEKPTESQADYGQWIASNLKH